jgi:hypothetical protein
VIDREFAVRLVEAQLEHEETGRVERLVVSEVEEHELAWIVFCQSAAYMRTGDPGCLLVGNGPFLVDRVDGGLHAVGVVSWVSGAWEADYRARIRGTTTRNAVDDLHEEIRETAATRGRIIAMHLLRHRVPELGHPDVIAYVTALQASEPVPSRLVAVSTRALVPDPDPSLRVRTLRAGRAGTG